MKKGTLIHLFSLLTLIEPANAGPYEKWVMTHGLSAGVNDGFHQDPNGDGITNIEHFAFGTSPLNSASAIQQGLSKVTVIDITGTDHLALTVAVRNGASFNGTPLATNVIDGAVRYFVKSNQDLKSFPSSLVTEITPADTVGLNAVPADYTYKTFGIPMVPSDDPSGFLWLEVKADDPPMGASYTVTDNSPDLSTYAFGDNNIINPMKGFHRWRNQELAANAGAKDHAIDDYQRYQWGDDSGSSTSNLEILDTSIPGADPNNPDHYIYDFSQVLSDYNDAVTAGKKFAFRIRCVGSEGEVHLPDYLSSNSDIVWDGSSSNQFVNWNNSYIRQRARLLFEALAAAIPDHDKLIWIDVGMVGNYGEWNTLDTEQQYDNAGVTTPSDNRVITYDSKLEWVDLQMENFPTVIWAAKYEVRHIRAAGYAIEVKAPELGTICGLRSDAFGWTPYFNQFDVHYYPDDSNPSVYPTIKEYFADHYKKAPFLGEPVTLEHDDPNKSPALLLQQLQDHRVSTIADRARSDWSQFSAQQQQDYLDAGRHCGYRYAINESNLLITGESLDVFITLHNEGQTPTYEKWNMEYYIGDTLQATNEVNLISVYDNSAPDLSDGITVDLSSISSGTHHVEVRLVSRNGSRPAPLYFSNTAANTSTGRLRLGTIEVVK